MNDSDVVIRVEGLGKKYALHHETREGYTALRDVMARQVKAAGRLLNPFTLAGQLRKLQRQGAQARPQSEEEFWALKDVSFEIRRGERVGIIGRNGAGKSTLLKILSRITEPTTGRVEIRGRVASLLEVGTGFHPELTGRENIYLNGAILGMTRREIRSKFDEIVDFAEVERFLDTQVKHYSSGMYVRLAFAVAAHLESEILMVDEVLAVGDAEFQSKCLNLLKDSQSWESSKTVLFVSHNLDHVRSLFERGIVLAGGELALDADATMAINTYRESLHVCKPALHSYSVNEQTKFPDSLIRSACIRDRDGSMTSVVYNSDPLDLEILFSLSKTDMLRIASFEIGFGIVDREGRWIFGCNNKHIASEVIGLSAGCWKASFRIGFFPLYRDEELWINLYAGWFDHRYISIERAFSIMAKTKISAGGIKAYEQKFCAIDMPGLTFSLETR